MTKKGKKEVKRKDKCDEENGEVKGKLEKEQLKVMRMRMMTMTMTMRKRRRRRRMRM